MSIQHLLTHYQPAGTGTGEEWFKQTTTDPVENYRVQELMEYIATNGFHNPIRITEEETEEDSGEHYNASVTNGMHRTAAAHHLGLETVLVTHSEPEPDEFETLILHLEAPDATDHDFDNAFALISSLYKDKWISSDLAIGKTPKHTSISTMPPEEMKRTSKSMSLNASHSSTSHTLSPATTG